MSKKIEMFYYQIEPGKVAELNVTFGAHLKQFKKDFGLDPKIGEQFFKAAVVGGEFPESLFEGIDPKELKVLKGQYASVMKAEKFHVAEEARREKQKQKEDAEKDKEAQKAAEEGKKFNLAVQGGRAIGAKFAEQGVDLFSRLGGKLFDIDAMGCKPKEGADIKGVNIAQLLSASFEAGDGLMKLQATKDWVVGDLLVLAETFGQDPVTLASQVASVTGQDKHTIQEAYRTSKAFPHDAREAGLSRTHYTEARRFLTPQAKTDEVCKEGKPLLTNAKVKAILAKALKGEKTVSAKTASGEEVEQYRPWSCKKLREELDEAAGITEEYKAKQRPAKTQAATPPTINVESETIPEVSGGWNLYLVFDVDGNAYKTTVLTKKTLVEMVRVYDLVSLREVLDDDGSPVEGDAIPVLPDEYADAPDEPEEAPAKKASKKASKKAAQAAEPEKEPESEEHSDIPEV